MRPRSFWRRASVMMSSMTLWYSRASTNFSCFTAACAVARTFSARGTSRPSVFAVTMAICSRWRNVSAAERSPSVREAASSWKGSRTDSTSSYRPSSQAR